MYATGRALDRVCAEGQGPGQERMALLGEDAGDGRELAARGAGTALGGRRLAWRARAREQILPMSMFVFLCGK